MSEKSNIICDTDLISRYHDRELGPEESLEIKAHIDSCPSCRNTLSGYAELTDKMQLTFNEVTAQDSLKIENRIIESIKEEKKVWWARWAELIFTKRILVPSALVASIAVLITTFTLDNPALGPSAIVTSLSGSGSTVMIMETAETRQTILWFNENG